MYSYNAINDLYENIYNKKINGHLRNKIVPENGLKLSVKLKQIYKTLIGYYTTR